MPGKRIVTQLEGAKDQANSRLFKLAPELRNQIYELAFDGLIVCIMSKAGENREGRSKVPGILMSCKQVYAEALQIFFNKAIFRFESTTKLKSWLVNIGPAHQACISRVDYRTAWTHSLRNTREQNNRGRVAQEALKRVEKELHKRKVFLEPGMLRIRVPRGSGEGAVHDVIYVVEADSDGGRQLVKQ